MSRSQGINIPYALPWCQAVPHSWNPAVNSDRQHWPGQGAARAPETAFNSKNQEKREKAQVSLRSPSNE